MKKLVILLSLTFMGCNTFDFLDPTGSSHLDRCKALADKGQYTEAIAECNLADPNGTNPEAQMEIGDAYLASIGLSLANVSDVFFDAGDGGTDTIVALAESILASNGAVTDQEKVYALAAITAFDLADSPLYSTLARLCYIAVIMAFTDSDGVGDLTVEGDGQITTGDLCAAASCNSPICIETSGTTTCNGISKTDAESAGEILTQLDDYLGNIEFADQSADLDDALQGMEGIEIPDPNDSNLLKTINEMGSSSWGDATRQLLYQMVE